MTPSKNYSSLFNPANGGAKDKTAEWRTNFAFIIDGVAYVDSALPDADTGYLVNLRAKLGEVAARER